MKFISVYIAKMKRNLEDYGLKQTCLKTLFAFIGIIFYFKEYVVYRKDLVIIDTKTENINEDNYQFLNLKENDLIYIAQIEKKAEWLRNELAMMLSKGGICIAVVYNSEVIAFNLINFGKVYLPIVNFYKEFNSDSAWSEHIAVDKGYRNRGLGTLLRIKIFDCLSDRGIKYIWGGCLKGNYASLKLAEKLGFEFIERIQYIKIFGLKKWQIKKIGNKN
ncbi:MAG: GNAT family N-acetyltransferase [Spirochaetes bacterium]|nr:GNAT family N-acetyltransferase [Spirochaetota bacterium]